MNSVNLEKIKDIAESLCKELNLDLISIRSYHDIEMGEMLEILIDHSYSITMDEIEEFTSKINPLIDELNIDDSYTLDISSGGSEREIPYSDLNKLIDRYLDIKLKKSGEVITAKLTSFDGIAKLTYFIKGRKKVVELKEEEIESIHMGYKA